MCIRDRNIKSLNVTLVLSRGCLMGTGAWCVVVPPAAAKIESGQDKNNQIFNHEHTLSLTTTRQLTTFISFTTKLISDYVSNLLQYKEQYTLKWLTRDRCSFYSNIVDRNLTFKATWFGWRNGCPQQLTSDCPDLYQNQRVGKHNAPLCHQIATASSATPRKRPLRTDV